MTSNRPTPPQLQKLGWLNVGVCGFCPGAKKWKYRHTGYPAYEVRWNTGTNKFSLKKHGATLYNHLSIADLEQVLSTLTNQ